MNEPFAVHEPISEYADVSSRLRSAIGRAGGNKAVSTRSGIPLSTLTTYLAGRDMKASAAAKIAHACSVSVDWLLTGVNSAPAPQMMAQAQSIVPIGADGTSEDDLVVSSLSVFVSGGDGATATDDFAFQRVRLPAASVTQDMRRDAKNLIALRLRGDSMLPIIEDGDTIVINTRERSVVNGKIYVLRLHDDLLAKRLSLKTNGNLVLTSDNPRYAPEEIDAQKARQMWHDGGAPAYVMGRVVWRGGAL